MAGVPIVAGDVGGPYTLPGTPPQVASFSMLSGTTKVLINGRSVMVAGNAQTAGGAIASSTLVSIKTLIEGAPVHLGGSVTNLTTGWLGGVLQPSGASGVIVG